MAKTCYICGARTKHPANLTCGFDPCKVEHLRRHPEARKPKAKMPAFGVDRGKMRKPLLYDSKLQVQCIVALACLALSACGTVAPKPVESHAASWDVNVSNGVAVQNSGIVDSDAKGYHVTPEYLLRYDDMLGKYGNFLSPVRKAGDRDGVTPESPVSPFYAQGSRWVFSIPARDRFHELNMKRRLEEAP